MAGRLHGLQHVGKIVRIGIDVHRTVVIADHVFGPRFERGLHDDVLVGPGTVADDALLAEHIGYGAVGAEIAAMLGEGVSHLGGGPVAVVGHAVDDDRHTGRAIALVSDLVVIAVVVTAGAAFDRAIDRIVGHIGAAGLVHRQSQARIRFDIATTLFRRHRHLADQLGPQLPPLFIVGCLLVLDIGPLAVTCHATTSPGCIETCAELREPGDFITARAARQRSS